MTSAMKRAQDFLEPPIPGIVSVHGLLVPVLRAGSRSHGLSEGLRFLLANETRETGIDVGVQCIREKREIWIAIKLLRSHQGG